MLLYHTSYSLRIAYKYSDEYNLSGTILSKLQVNNNSFIVQRANNQNFSVINSYRTQSTTFQIDTNHNFCLAFGIYGVYYNYKYILNDCHQKSPVRSCAAHITVRLVEFFSIQE